MMRVLVWPPSRLTRAGSAKKMMMVWVMRQIARHAARLP